MKTVFQNEDISKIIETREITAARKSVNLTKKLEWIHTDGVKHSNAHKQRWILVSD